MSRDFKTLYSNKNEWTFFYPSWPSFGVFGVVVNVRSLTNINKVKQTNTNRNNIIGTNRSWNSSRRTSDSNRQKNRSFLCLRTWARCASVGLDRVGSGPKKTSAWKASKTPLLKWRLRCTGCRLLKT